MPSVAPLGGMEAGAPGTGHEGGLGKMVLGEHPGISVCKQAYEPHQLVKLPTQVKKYQ